MTLWMELCVWIRECTCILVDTIDSISRVLFANLKNIDIVLYMLLVYLLVLLDIAGFTEHIYHHVASLSHY